MRHISDKSTIAVWGTDPIGQDVLLGYVPADFTEAAYLQFRADFLNAFNNVNLGHPDTSFSATSSTFGQIGPAVGSPASQPARNIQFALKMYF